MTEASLTTLPPLCDVKGDPLAALPLFQRLRVLMVNVARVTCEKCGRIWYAPILEKWFINHYGKLTFAQTVRTEPRCSRCSPPQRQPQEGDTFHRRRSQGRGKFLVIRDRRDRDGELVSAQETLDYLAQNSSWCCDREYRNREAQERERICTPEWIREQAPPEEIRRVFRLLTQSRAKFARLYKVPENIVRTGRTELLLALLDAAARA